jgi:hypothetical protein
MQMLHPTDLRKRIHMKDPTTRDIFVGVVSQLPKRPDIASAGGDLKKAVSRWVWDAVEPGGAVVVSPSTLGEDTTDHDPPDFVGMTVVLVARLVGVSACAWTSKVIFVEEWRSNSCTTFTSSPLSLRRVE